MYKLASLLVLLTVLPAPELFGQDGVTATAVVATRANEIAEQRMAKAANTYVEDRSFFEKYVGSLSQKIRGIGYRLRG